MSLTNNATMHNSTLSYKNDLDACGGTMTTTNTLSNALIWIDCEMTGLDLKKDKIIEIAIIVTDWKLNILHSFDPMVIHVEAELLDSMDEWNQKHHGESGLITQVKESNISMEDAESIVVNFLQNECKLEKGTCILSGNSVHADKEFLRKDMPRVLDLLHYVILDVSSFKIAAHAFNPSMAMTAPKKLGLHRALDDIKESIEEFRYYVDNFLIHENKIETKKH